MFKKPFRWPFFIAGCLSIISTLLVPITAGLGLVPLLLVRFVQVTYKRIQTIEEQIIGNSLFGRFCCNRNNVREMGTAAADWTVHCRFNFFYSTLFCDY